MFSFYRTLFHPSAFDRLYANRRVPTLSAVGVKRELVYIISRGRLPQQGYWNHFPQLSRACPNFRIFGLRNLYGIYGFRARYTFGHNVLGPNSSTGTAPSSGGTRSLGNFWSSTTSTCVMCFTQPARTARELARTCLGELDIGFVSSSGSGIRPRKDIGNASFLAVEVLLQESVRRSMDQVTTISVFSLLRCTQCHLQRDVDCVISRKH